MEPHDDYRKIEEMSRDIRGNCKLFIAFFITGILLLSASVAFALSPWEYGELLSLLMNIAGICVCTLAVLVAIIVLKRMEGMERLIDEFKF